MCFSSYITFLQLKKQQISMCFSKTTCLIIVVEFVNFIHSVIILLVIESIILIMAALFHIISRTDFNLFLLYALLK